MIDLSGFLGVVESAIPALVGLGAVVVAVEVAALAGRLVVRSIRG